ncbi:6,7-dimethyl-8-ribityllumazine synthase [Candidatus Falkowbacteria bacterium RIFOXYC2_FULL_47_12]|uniref:6,7-dimethyl-8-ribityllumazine synthase n=2 Tax=Candidatus Falkowiibacteriota TaxID=1752728 RepID=A0A1F5TLJ4_9BACT|nr:MAG: 6,7-dimethyl-8-ribityllumazine synthase [Candidatus Falkowbacteria bacterium RIFOXYA2_FULL_47_9]OGF39788.1 MAG: 6,7-dimethyl-8-ribityllumazine synthase [Candidatus Falkowbacteria bacterium RIFOXYC2_FULL_47_12]
MKSNKKIKIAIVAANFYPGITGRLISGARTVLRTAGVLEKNITVQLVPGCFELPLACQKMAQRKTCDALIALGCAIRGETDHYTYIAQGMTHGIMDVMLKYDKPIGFGVILVDSRKLALARSGAKINYGAGAAQAALAILHNKE